MKTTLQLLKTGSFSKAIRILLFALLFVSSNSYAQNCTVNAGIDFFVCDDTQAALSGAVGGLYDASSIQWTQISGPASTIVSPSNVSTSITGLAAGNTYQYQLELDCNFGGTVTDLVNVTVVSMPSFTAGPDLIMCNSTTPNLAGVLPAGYTGNWSTSSSLITIADPTNPTSTISATSGCFTGSTLTWSITNGTCTYVDEVEITGVGDPGAANMYTQTRTICGTSTSFVLSCAPLAYAAATNVTQTSGPATASISISPWFNTSTSIFVSNLTAIGTYTFSIVATSTLCGGTYTGTFTVIVNGTGNPVASMNTNVPVNEYSWRSHLCGATFLTDYDTIWLNGTVPTPSGGINNWTITAGFTIDDPTADSTFATFTGPSLNYRIDIYRSVTVGSCTGGGSRQFLLYNEPEPVHVPDTVLCSGSSIQISGADGLSPIYSQYWNHTNPEAFYMFGPSYGGVITQIGGPSVTVTYNAESYTGNLANNHLTFNGLAAGNIYTFTFEIPVTNALGSSFPYYNCYSGPTIDTFSIVYPDPLGANSGTSQFLECDSTSTDLAGITGIGQSGLWSMVSGPTSPTIGDATSPSTDVTNMSTPGDYLFLWDAINVCGDTQSDTVLITVPNCSPLGVELAASSVQCENVPILNWATSTERDNDYFTIRRSLDAVNFELIDIVSGSGTSNQQNYYEYVDESYADLNMGTPVYYELSQTDFSGERTILDILGVNCGQEEPNISMQSNGALLVVFDSPYSLQVYSADGRLVIEGESKGMFSSEEYLATGVYTIRIVAENGKVFNAKRLFRRE